MNSRYPGRPKSEGVKGQCKAEECVKIADGPKGFCKTHYIYSRKGIVDQVSGKRLKQPQRISKYGDGARCIVGDCKSKPISHGMCNRHSIQRSSGIIDSQGTQLRPLMAAGRRRERDRWVGSTRDGYVLVVAPDNHPHARQDGSILEHRLVMEGVVGRYLEEWEIVHHKDGNRQNNLPQNLELLDGRAKSSGPGHHPGHEFDLRTAIRIVLQQQDIPDVLRESLTIYRTALAV